MPNTLFSDFFIISWIQEDLNKSDFYEAILTGLIQ